MLRVESVGSGGSGSGCKCKSKAHLFFQLELKSVGM